MTDVKSLALSDHGPVLALSGGIGGAKLALGLYRVLPPRTLTVVANTADDFEHLGLHVCPDVDTLMYTLAGINNPDTGWGRADETWHFMDSLAQLGGDTWFQLGDRDLATNVERTRRLALGQPLTEVTHSFCAALNLSASILPMTDADVRTRVRTRAGELPFQVYFVGQQCAPVVEGFRFSGVDQATPSIGFMAALRSPELTSIVICPSNPFISIDPILSLPGVKDALGASSAPVVIVSPLIGGRAVKGPTAKMMHELGLTVSVESIVEHYRDVIDAIVVDHEDAHLTDSLGVPVLATSIMMRTLADRERLAEEVLQFCHGLRRAPVS